MKRQVRVGSLVFALSMSAAAHAGVITVGPGESIQDAINVAKNGATIMVEPGIYPESIDFLGKAITVISTGGAAVTTIDAGSVGTVVRFMSGEQSGSRLQGFTLTGGVGDIELYGHPVGGGMVTGEGAAPAIANCVFRLNNADFGGGMFNDGEPSLVNCSFQTNTGSMGGGVFNNNADPHFVNCTFTGNSADWGGSFYNVGSTPLIENSILWSNEAPEIQGSNAVVRFSNVQGGWSGPGSNNISASPSFVDADGRLGGVSPCIDAADSDAYTGGPNDLDELDRFLDDEATVDTGAGKTTYLDMGAFEYVPIACRADFDGDGYVGFMDLVQLLTVFGPCGARPGDCPEDLDRDGEVDFDDLLLLLTAWGLSC